MFSTIGVKGALEELVPKFEKSSGHKLNVTWSTAALLVKRVEAGEQADRLILTKNNLERSLKEGKDRPGTETPFGQLSFRRRDEDRRIKPDISTPEAFKQSLLARRESAIPIRLRVAPVAFISPSRSTRWESPTN